MLSAFEKDDKDGKEEKAASSQTATETFTAVGLNNVNNVSREPVRFGDKNPPAKAEEEEESSGYFMFFVKAILVTGVLCAAVLYFEERFRIGIDSQLEPCIPKHVFLIDSQVGTPERGELYRFTRNVQSTRPPFRVSTRTFLKRAAGMPGDDVEITKEGKLIINGEMVKESMPLLRFNKKSPAEYAFKRRLGKDEYFFVGDHHDSFDSRYWGTVKGFELTGHGYALF